MLQPSSGMSTAWPCSVHVGGGGGEGGGGGGGERAGTHGTSGSWLPSAGLPCGERRVRTRKTANPMAMGARPLVEGGEFLSMAVMCTT